MIRREVSNGTDSPGSWLLISQIDHAHLAFRLAHAWGATPFTRLVERDQLLWAIDHHDDGWRDWERQPEVDPDSGRPRSFTEMEASDSLAIWSGSIVASARQGALAGYVVAGHFAALAGRIAEAGGAAERRSVERFIKVQEELMAHSLAAWQTLDPVANTVRQARLALAQLQFFDLLSLWLCCDETTEPDRVEPPGGPELTLTPISASHVRVAPWPFLAPTLELDVSAQQVPAGHYASSRELALAPSQPAQLRWLLQADAGTR